MPAGNILVVDDDPILVELFRMRLESANYRVTERRMRLSPQLKGKCLTCLLSTGDLARGME